MLSQSLLNRDHKDVQTEAVKAATAFLTVNDKQVNILNHLRDLLPLMVEVCRFFLTLLTLELDQTRVFCVDENVNKIQICCYTCDACGIHFKLSSTSTVT